MSRLIRSLLMSRPALSRIPTGRRPGSRLQSNRQRLKLVNLEDRCTPATFTVLNTMDVGADSLRDCVSKADLAAGNDTVDFGPLFATPQVITLASQIGIAPVTLTDGLVIQGTGKANLTISGGGLVRIFQTDAAGTFSVTFNDLTLDKGFNSVGRGAAIKLGDESVILNNCTVSNNTNTGLSGVAISSQIAGGKLTLNNCLITGNNNTTTAATLGSAIRIASGATGSLTMTDCVVSNNGSATTGARGAVATNSVAVIDRCTFINNTQLVSGALNLSALVGTAKITNSTFSGNVNTSGFVNGGGAAIGAIGYGAALGAITIQNSTISGNSAVTQGGGISLYITGATPFAAPLTIQNSTITGNTANSLGAYLYEGGGIWFKNVISTSAFKMDSTIVANNSAKSELDISNGSGPLLLAKFSLIENTTGTKLDPGSASNITGVDPLLGALGSYGGPTAVHLLSPFSPALDTGSNPVPLANDQRGAPFAREVPAGKTDMGAVEIDAAIPFGFATSPNVTVAGGTVQVITVDYSDLVGIDTTTLGDADLTITGPGGPVGVVFKGFTGGATKVQATYEMTPPGGFWNQPDIGTWIVNMNLGQVADLDGTVKTVPAGVIGSFTVSTPPTIPQAKGSGPVVVNADSVPQTITVVYTDDLGMDTASLGSADLSITGPGGPYVVTFKGFTGGGKSVSATYEMAAPGGTWDLGDNGTYTINVVVGEVLDADTPVNSVAAGKAGTFAVALSTTFVVNATNDETTDTDKLLSLREALALANLVPESNDTITFDPAVFTGLKTITSAKGEYLINGLLTLTGPAAAADRVTLDAATLNRVFNTTAAPTGAAIAISNLTMTNGKRSATQTRADNGGVMLVNDENVTLTNCVLSNSVAIGGGAVHVELPAGKLTLNDCTLSGNSANGTTNGYHIGDGGAITSRQASVIINRSSITGNTAVTGQGAIYFGFKGSLLMTDSTISGNTSAGATGGGAIYFYGPITGAGFKMTNSTISGNKATGGPGGAISFYVLDGTAVFNNVTITANDAKTAGGGIARSAGTATGLMTLNSSIVAGNTVAGAGGVSKSDFFFDAAVSVPGDNNLIGVNDPAGNNVTFTGVGNQLGPVGKGLNAKLGPLASNGGPTQTHALLLSSPAFNKGNNALVLANDQRGAPFGRVVGVAADVGAFEQGAPAKIAAFTVNGGTTGQRSRVTSIEVTFDQPVNPTAATAFTLVRPSDATSVALTGVMSGGNTIVTLTFLGAGSEFGSLADGRYTLTGIATKLSTPTGALFDGNGDGVAGDNFVHVGAPGTAPNLFRQFGDGDGDGDTDVLDFINGFRPTFGRAAPDPLYNPVFDHNNDGDVDAADALEFRDRFGEVI